MIDLILSRYGSLEYATSLSVEDFAEFISFALKKKEEELLFSRWINGHQFQIGFDDFIEQLKPKRLRDEKEILNEVRQILAFAEKGGLHGNL